MYRHILVAVGIQSDSVTLEAAIRLASECGAHLTALHVVDPMPRHTLAADCNFGYTIDIFEAYGRAIAEHNLAALRKAGCDGDAHTIMLPMCGTTVGRAIACHAQEIDADLIVVGNRKATLLGLFGEHVYKQVLRYAQAPVLVATDALPAASSRALALRPRYAETVSA